MVKGASLQNFSWQGGGPWAPLACYRNGNDYPYCPLNQNNRRNGNRGIDLKAITLNQPSIAG
jgi:hypothetical protein